MENEILDADLSTQSDKKLTVINWISIIILWIGIGICFSIGIITSGKIIAAALFLIITTLISYFNFKLGVKTTLLVIFLAVIALIKFFPTSYEIGFSINNFVLIGFEVIALAIGILHYYTNKSILKPFIKSFFKEPKDEKIANQNSKINSFKNKFNNRNLEELQAIAANQKMITAARKAAQELINEREAIQ